MEVQARYITAERFLDLLEQPEYQDRSFDLVEGELVEMSKPTVGHGEIVSWLNIKIGSYIVENALGRVCSGDAGFILARSFTGRDTVRGLDFAFIAKERAPGPLDFSWYEQGPDLAVEVISPNNRADDIHLKVMQLLAAGTGLIWLVYPESRTVVAHSADGAKTLHEGDRLDGGDVLPGFALRVGDIFPS